MYRKNTASQFICFQMLLTASGAVATGLSPTVRRCIDGTFAAGGGTVTEDGTTGSYKYAMSQADTNGNDVSFIFSAATAIPVCVNIVTTAADPTNAATFGITDIDATISSRSTYAGGAVASVTGAVGSVTAGVTVTTNNDKTGYTASTVSDKTGYALTAAYDPAKTASQAGDAMALTTGERNSTADALLNRDMSTGADNGSTTVRTMRQALRFLRNKWSISGTTLTVTKEDDSTASWTSTVTTDAAANPITANDPAGP